MRGEREEISIIARLPIVLMSEVKLIIHNFQDVLLLYVERMLLLLSILLLILFVFYLFSSIAHLRRKKHFNKNIIRWKNTIDSYIKNKSIEICHEICKQKCHYLRDMLIYKYRNEENNREIIKELYLISEYYKEDIRDLKNNAWWKKVAGPRQ